MGEMFDDNGRLREIVKVACPKGAGNDQGFYIQYRDAMRPDEIEFRTEGPFIKPTKLVKKKGKKK